MIVGGAQENTLFTAERINPNQFRTEIVCGPQTGPEGSLIEEAGRRGVSLTLLPALVRQISPPDDLRALNGLSRLIRDRRSAIVHTHSSKAGILGRIAARMAGAPVILHTIHGWSFHDHMPARTRLIYIWLERLAASFSDALIVVAEKDIQKGLDHKIGRREQYQLIRSAIPLDEFDPGRYDRAGIRAELGIPIGAPVLGNVGRFSAQKNPLDWVQAAGEVGRRLPKARFLLVGDGPMQPQVVEALKQAAIFDRAILTGLRRDPARMMAAMDVFLLTSLWEGLPRVIPQAMAMGVPVIANRADGTSEAIHNGRTGFLVDPGDLHSTVDWAVELLSDPARRQSIAAAAQAYARREFDLTEMIARIEVLYTRLLQQKGVI
jgi:glycosyltransferase involved in cell wall biosynthesis